MDIDNNNNEAKYTVYISFDDNDSSISTFINYLRATFKRHGIYELDDEKDRFFEQLRVLVMVFSSNYKFSMPANLVNHLTNKDLVVVPVFHGVTVSSAKQQIEELEPSSSVTPVTMWPRVLLESALLPAHVYNDERSESKFMEEIARDVFEKLYPTEEIGIHRLQLDIENLLCKQPWGLRSLGIFGDPGIGKTTLARAIFRRMSCEYDVSCFIKDFNKEYNQNMLGPLSDEFLSETPMEEFDQKRTLSKSSHRRKRVLIALDDVQNDKDAESFLGGGFGPGSLIIITSRDEQVLKECHVNEIYELQGLNQEDALKLFMRSAFGKDVTQQNLLDFSMEKIERANGNPSTILAYAMREIELPLLDIRDVSSTDQESSCDVKNTPMLKTLCGEDDEPDINTELQSYRNFVFVSRMRDFINFTGHVMEYVKTKISMNESYFMCIVMTLVLGMLWKLLGNREVGVLAILYHIVILLVYWNNSVPGQYNSAMATRVREA